MRRMMLVAFGLLTSAFLLVFVLGYLDPQPWGEVPANVVPRTPVQPGAAFYASGDMGIEMGFGRPIVRAIADSGVPLITLNGLTYFRNSRARGEIQLMVRRAVELSISHYHISKVVLIGQSLGAEALVVGFEQLPPALRAHVAGLILIVPSESYMLRSSPGGAFSFWEPEFSILPYTRELALKPVVCLRGADEQDSLCPRLHGENIEQITLPGGHLLDFAGATVAKIVTNKTKALLAGTVAAK